MKAKNSLFDSEAGARLLREQDGHEAAQSPWMSFYRRRPDAKVRLFCLHHAGAGASAFKSWLPLLPSWIDVALIQLPGREERASEDAITEVAPLLAELVELVRRHDDLPFALFGHSMGGLISFVLSQHLEHTDECIRLPSQLFISATPPPHARNAGNEPDFSDEALIEEMIKLGGTPNELLASEDYRRYVLPSMRADAVLCEHLKATERSAITPNITVLAGRSDPVMPLTHAFGWKKLTKGIFDVQTFTGDHFYIRDHRDQIVNLLVQRLTAFAR